MSPRKLQNEIKQDFRVDSSIWSSYKNSIASRFAQTNYQDLSDHLLRDYNRKIDNLGLNRNFMFTPFDAGFRFTGSCIPTLDCNFAEDRTIVPRVGPTPTFSRASGATEIGSDGFIRYAPENLLLQSETFGTTWTASQLNTTGTPSYLNVAESPIGTVTADKIIANTTTGTHQFRQDATLVAGVVYVLSCYFKAAEQQFASIQAFGVANGNNDWLSLFDVSSSPSTGTIIGFTNSSVTSVGNGWNRCVVVFTATASGSLSIRIGGAGTKASGGQFYTGDNSSGILVWGAQLERHTSARTYIPTTTAAVYGARFDHDPVTLASRGLLIEESRTNLATWSEKIDDVSWIKSFCTINPDVTAAPNGLITADKITEDTTTNFHGVRKSPTVTASTTCIASIYLKAGGRNFALIYTTNPTARGRFVSIPADGTGTVLGNFNATNAVVTLQYVGNGWYRATIEVNSGAGFGAAIEVSTAINGTTANYTGDGTSGIFVWGAQVEAGAFPTSYIPTTTTALTRSADVCSITGANFTSFYNQSEGTMFTDSYPATVAGTVTTFGISNGTASARWLNRFAQNEQVVVTASGVESTLDAINPVANQRVKVASAAKLNDLAMSIDGLAVVTDTSQPMPTVDRAGIGNATGATAGAVTISRIQYYPKRLSNKELQILTSP